MTDMLLLTVKKTTGTNFIKPMKVLSIDRIFATKILFSIIYQCTLPVLRENIKKSCGYAMFIRSKKSFCFNNLKKQVPVCCFLAISH